mgnify:CR=1 FL=1
MTWHYLAEQAGASLEDICSDGVPLQPLRSKITHAAFCSNGKLTASYLDSLSGTTFAPSTENRGEEKLMSSREDSPVRTSQQPAPGLDCQERGRDYGPNKPESLAKWNRHSRMWKTRQFLLHEGLESFSETFPTWGTMQDGELLARTPPELSITGLESGCWLPTIGKNEFRGTSRKRYWRSEDYRAAKMAEGVRTSKDDPIYLSPSFSEEAMMWPIMWTALAPLAMDKFQRWQHSHGEFYQETTD